MTNAERMELVAAMDAKDIGILILSCVLLLGVAFVVGGEIGDLKTRVDALEQRTPAHSRLLSSPSFSSTQLITREVTR